MQDVRKDNQASVTQIATTRISTITSGLASAIAISALALILSACNGTGQIGQDTTTQEVTDQTQRVVGEETTLRSSVNQQIDDFSFTMVEDGRYGSGEILVLNASGEPTLLPENMDLQVTGEVAQFSLTDIQANYGLQLDNELYAQYEQQPVIIAESIALAPTAQEVLNEPEFFYNQIVAIEENVADSYSPTALVLDDDNVVDGDGLLVIGVTPEATLQTGTEVYERVVVTGEIRPFIIGDIESEYNYQWDGWDTAVREDAEVEYANRPVLIADSIYLAPRQN